MQIAGQQFGKWLVLWEAGRTPRKQRLHVCQCNCGKVQVVTEDNLKRGRTSSCVRCVERRTHGMCGTPEYRAWAKAKDRCTNPRCVSYPDYGGRGIGFQFDSFEHWYAELGPRPAKHSVDRIDNDGPYAPGNVRWATQSQQNYNRRCAA